MLQREKERKQRERWEKMKKRGHIPYLAINVSIFLGSYALVRLLHILCFKLGWLRSPGSMSWEDVFFLCGADWSNSWRIAMVGLEEEV